MKNGKQGILVFAKWTRVFFPFFVKAKIYLGYTQQIWPLDLIYFHNKFFHTDFMIFETYFTNCHISGDGK